MANQQQQSNDQQDQRKMETIDAMQIHYRIYGSGPSVLLLLHGAVGSYNDFAHQMERECGLQPDQFTVIAPDLPGCGRSQLVHAELKPCEPRLEYFELCAEVCAKLMAKLGHKTYSLGGWNDGARVAALLAIKCQSRVNALVLWGFSPTMDQESCWATARTRDTSIWEPSILQNYTQVYGEQQFSDLWRHYVDFVVRTLEEPQQFDIRARLNQIKCPTLVLHGSNDPIISYRAHVKPIEMQIYDSEIKQMAGLAHNLHQADPAEFNQVMARFVSSVVVAS